MKTKTLVSFFVLFIAFSASGQEFKQPAEGKSLVYFVRFSGIGALINFKYFDGEQYLGKANGINYYIYECDPGEHLFWAASENRDFIKGDLKPNSTYILEVRPKMGGLKAAVRLHPVSPDNEKVMKKVRKMVAKTGPTALKGLDDDMVLAIESGMERYEKIKDEVKIIDSNWVFK